jgi:hypothetical protein
MRERPILFSGPMVRALLDGSKTQTRRVVKLPRLLQRMSGELVRAWVDNGGPNNPFAGVGEQYLHVPCTTDVEGTPMDTVQRLYCPYGVPGDRLWVKEAIRAWTYADDDDSCVEYTATGHIHDDATWVWKRDSLPGMFMPRGLSRITLEITDVRVERLQDISEDDARAEGCALPPSVNEQASRTLHRVEYFKLWESLNAARGYGWDANPWVWVVSFNRAAEVSGGHAAPV